MVITEYLLRNQLKDKDQKEYYLDENAILTPSAKQFLADKKIEIIRGNKKIEAAEHDVEEKLPKFRGLNGEYYLEKGEAMTQLKDNILVPKTNKRIVLRGKLDNLLAEWNLVHKRLLVNKNPRLKEDLESLFKFIKKIQMAEIMDEPIGDPEVLGYSLEKIKEISHNPKKYFDTEHLFGIDFTYDELVLELNRIRTIAREVELSAMEALYDHYGEKENELIRALNRLSSVIYVMMLKGKSGGYGSR